MSKIIIGKDLVFIGGDEAYPGAVRIAGAVREDIRKVTGYCPAEQGMDVPAENAVIYGTFGHSGLLDKLAVRGVVDKAAVAGKWEVYSFTVVSEPFPGIKNALIIAGSDKRGTIYGLFRLSELIGVSPLVNWNNVMPCHRESVVLDDTANCVSAEPSVKYRGFFINDEYPAFGTWAKEHFGGVNAECYSCVFELLLRLKGNYLWPAMWKDNFSMDGPGIKSAELADELGVVMSTSHHEPCMRSGEEYTLLRGPGSPYGDAWSFLENEEGITKFWEDGLIRTKDFENVITVGMRGERDSAILGKESTLKDNIDLLKKVIRTQNELIKKIIDPDLDKVPRQMVLFSEVEEFFYGSDENAGLIDDPDLSGV
ncbi:MAG: glycosyl hydrolase 115 family protein, partial [Ruminiclostridium sp.]|nr:glycosyl hydrolase 115 family protein [Ruminiclostridium sp.]